PWCCSAASSSMTAAHMVQRHGEPNPRAGQLRGAGTHRHLFPGSPGRQGSPLSGSAGTDNTECYVSLGFLEDPSYIRGSEFSRYNVRSNVNAQLYDWLKVGANVGYSYRDTQSPATRFGRNPGSAVANVFRWINGQSPLISLFARDENGNIIKNADGSNKVHEAAGDSYSPLGMTKAPTSTANLIKLLDDDIDQRVSNDLNLKGYATVSFLDDFKFTANLSYDRFSEVRTRYGNSETGPYQGIGAFGKTYQNVAIFNAQQLLTWYKEIGK